jgi:hypothetical protein
MLVTIWSSPTCRHRLHAVVRRSIAESTGCFWTQTSILATLSPGVARPECRGFVVVPRSCRPLRLRPCSHSVPRLPSRRSKAQWLAQQDAPGDEHRVRRWKGGSGSESHLARNGSARECPLQGHQAPLWGPSWEFYNLDNDSAEVSSVTSTMNTTLKQQLKDELLAALTLSDDACRSWEAS